MKTSTKLILAFTAVLVPFIITALMSIKDLSALSDSLEVLTKDRVPKIISVEKLIINASRIQMNIREILLIDNATQKEKVIETMQKTRGENAKIRDELKNSIKSEEGKRLISTYTEKNSVLVKINEQVLELDKKGMRKEATELLLTQSTTARLEQRKSLQDLIDFQKNIMNKNAEESVSLVTQAKWIISIIAIIGLILGIFGAIVVTRSILSSLSSIQSGLQSFFSFLNRETSKAELIKLDSKDEFGQMAVAINNNISAIEKGLIADANAVANSVEVANKIKAGYLNEQITANPNNPQLIELRNVLNEMLQTLSSKVSHDLNELDLVFKAFIASDFTARIKDPKGQVDIITNNLGNEISNMLSSSLQNGVDLQNDASTLKQAVESLSTASNQQAASLEETAAAMEEMTSNVQNNVSKSNEMANMAKETDSAAREGAVLAQRTATAMTEIQSATNSINDAVAIIENIAFQTNILSLNAAVEAATAGDAGKGFAVVAQEVRNLANRSADAAKEIKAMAAQAAGKSNEGMNIATELTRGFEVIADKIAQTASMVQDVSNANREQMQGIGQINTAVTQLDQMTQENAKVAAQADSIANATISKAQAMVEDAQSKEFVGKNNIRATATRTNAKPVQAAKPVVVKQKYASNAIAKNSSKHESDVWESF